MANPETVLTEKIRKAIRAAYPHAWIFKVHGDGYQMPGIPDLILVIDGMTIGAEVKCKQPGESLQHAKERATTLQRAQIAAINRAGGIASVVTSPEETLDLIRRGFLKREAQRLERVQREEGRSNV
jgi:hypothetical protein